MATNAHDAHAMIGHGLHSSADQWAARVGKPERKSFVTAHTTAANDDHHSDSLPVLATFEQLFTEAWQNADKPISGDHADIYHMAEIEVQRELRNSIDANAMLKFSPDDYMRLHQQMQELAHAMVRETRDLAANAGKTQIGANVFREKVKQSVKKFIGNKHNTTHEHCSHVQATQQQAKQGSLLPTLSHICGFDLSPAILPTHTHS